MSELLWLVEIDEDDWDYDNFEIAAVWAETAERAEQIVRAEKRPNSYDPDTLWIENPNWRLHVRPAPTQGVALVHWHAG
jgi:hypothetical protein